MGLGLPRDVNVAIGAAFRREDYEVVAGERASWINGYHLAFDSSGIALQDLALALQISGRRRPALNGSGP